MTGCGTRRCTRPATATVVAGTPGQGTYRTRATCDEHFEQARRWATAAGTVTVIPTTAGGLVQAGLFDGTA